LEYNQIVDIQALVNNSGLGTGDCIDLRYNYLDLTLHPFGCSRQLSQEGDSNRR
jgi:hypothetical protein